MRSCGSRGWRPLPTDVPRGFTVTVPASTANLGPGLDVLALALDLTVSAGSGAVPESGGRRCDERHPAQIAYRRAGGRGELWLHSPIPMGRGLGYSGAVRVAGIVVAMAEQDPSLGGSLPSGVAADVVAMAAELEGHADNAAASVHGGLVVVAGDRVSSAPVLLDAVVVVWIPDGTTTSTDRSRSRLPEMVALADAVFNIGRTATLVTAFVTGDVDGLRSATDDRLHQAARLAAAPDSADALTVGSRSGAWCGWLSGSGPSVAFLCDPARVTDLAAALPSDGHTKILGIDRSGTVVRRQADAARSS